MKIWDNRMTVFWIVVSVLILFGAICLISWVMVMGGFVELEKRAAHRDVLRSQEVVANRINNLLVEISDWSVWDDSYAFIEDMNEAYIKSNLTSIALETLQLDAMIFFNVRDELAYAVYSKSYNPDKKVIPPLPEGLKKLLIKKSVFLAHPDEKSFVSGIMMTPEGPMMAASKPIVKSDGSGPVKGTIIFAKYLDANELKRFSEIIKVDLSIRRIDESSLPPDFSAAHKALLKGGGMFVESLDAKTIIGYTMLKDVSGKPAIILKAVMPREITQFGRKILGYFIWALFFVGFIFGVAVYLPLEKEITERRKIEKALLGQRNLLSNVIEGTNTGTWQWNILTGETALNERWAEIIGYTLEELAPVSNQTRISLTHPDDLKISEDLLRKHFAGALGYYDCEYRMKHRNGFWVWVNDRGKVIEWTADGKPMVMTGTHSDITERKKMQEALEKNSLELSDRLKESVKDRKMLSSMLSDNNQIREKLEDGLKKLKDTQSQLIHAEKMEAIGKMASGIAHEVKNPLGIILQGLNYFEGEVPLEQASHHKILKMMKDSIIRADTIIRALLDFSRSEELKIELQDIRPIIYKSISLVQHRFKFGGIELVCELGDDLPKTLIDTGRMVQVFVNLFNNAADAMPKGGKLHVRSYLAKLENPRDGVGNNKEDIFRLGEEAIIVEVEDTGIGIDESIIEKIFDPFFTTKSMVEGTGLGLSIAKSIIDMHRGLIYAENVNGKGAKFTIVLKAAN